MNETLNSINIDGYYTKEMAMKILNVTEGNFRALVKFQKTERKVEFYEGKKRALYSAKQIDELAKLRKEKKQKKSLEERLKDIVPISIDGYYTAEMAMKVLDVSQNTFKHLINTQKTERKKGYYEGKKRVLYSVKQIDELARLRKEKDLKIQQEKALENEIKQQEQAYISLNYYKREDALKVLRISSRHTFESLVKEHNIEIKRGNHKKRETDVFLKKDIDALVELQKKQAKIYIGSGEAERKYSYYIAKQANKLRTPTLLKFEGGINSPTMFLESDLLEICEKLYLKFDKNGCLVKKHWTEVLDPNIYCTTEQAAGLLNMGLQVFRQFVKVYNINHFEIKVLGRGYFYKIDDIQQFIDMRKKDNELYLDNTIAVKKYSISLTRKLTAEGKNYPVPLYMSQKDCTQPRFRFLISDLEEARLDNNLEFIADIADGDSQSNLKVKEGFKRKITRNTNKKEDKPLFTAPIAKTKISLFYEQYADNPTEMFLELCKIRGIDLDSLAIQIPYTIMNWKEFAFKRIDDFSGASNKYKWKVNELVNSTKYLLNIINIEGEYKEVYTISTKDISKHFKKLNQVHRINLLMYLRSVHKEALEELTKQGSDGKNLFSIIELEKIHSELLDKQYKKSKKPKVDDIYPVDTFLDVFNYANDIDTHIKNCIEEYELFQLCTYASTWLTVLIHLNNGWRLNDASNFKRIYIDDILNKIGIENINWFKSNKLTLEFARLIISRVSQGEFIVTKTKMKGHYFCSDELACSVASAVIFLTLTSKKIEDSIPVLTDFYTDDNHPTAYQFKRFFKGFKISNFVFTSLKMNKTLLTYIFSINGGLSEDTALKIVSKMRGHATEDMILHYIKLNEDEVAKISKILFHRGEFGYIYEMLIDGLQEENCNTLIGRKEKNELAQSIKDKFCKVYNIEFLAGFFNEYKVERAKIVDEIKGKSLEERMQKLTDIYSSKLHSKEIGIQCFVGIDNCPALKKGENRDCNKCACHIPSLMAVKDISLDFYNNILAYHDKTISYGKKLKLSVSLNHNIEILASAIETYGVDLVYSFMDHEIHEIENLFNQVLEPDFIYKKYLLGGN